MKIHKIKRIFAVNQVLYALTKKNTVHRFDDAGKTWIRLPDILIEKKEKPIKLAKVTKPKS